MTTIKVMADYHCYPLWITDECGPDNVDPRSLDISVALAEQLDSWAEQYDATLDNENPLQSGFSSPTAHAQFVSQGKQLSKQLARELEKRYTVIYYNDMLSQVEELES